MFSSTGSSGRPGPGCGLLALAFLTVTTSCAETTTWQRLSADQGRDIPCFRHQVVESGVPFYRAVAICKTKLPDLTGDTELQSAALASNVPFTIRPNADAAIKAFNRDQNVDTGSHLAGPHPSLDLVGGIHE